MLTRLAPGGQRQADAARSWRLGAAPGKLGMGTGRASRPLRESSERMLPLGSRRGPGDKAEGWPGYAGSTRGAGCPV